MIYLLYIYSYLVLYNGGKLLKFSGNLHIQHN